MKVKDLIERLKLEDQDSYVVIQYDSSTYYGVEGCRSSLLIRDEGGYNNPCSYEEKLSKAEKVLILERLEECTDKLSW